MSANPVLLAILSGFSMLIFRMLISHRPLRLGGVWLRILLSTFLGAALWLGLVVFSARSSALLAGDLVCGVLILLCAFWCNYWISNLAGGFRAQMVFNLAEKDRPVALDEWMAEFGQVGMQAFLADRTNSILLPWKIATLRDGRMQLLPGWGMFFGRLMKILGALLYRLRRNA